MSVTIYHNPRCSKSRRTLELIEQSGTPHQVVLYLEDTPSAATLIEIADKLKRPVSEIMRHGESVVKEAGDLPALDDDAALAGWLATNPIAIERPIVVNDESGDAVIGRPPENVTALLDS